MNRVLANRIIFLLALAGLYVSLRLTIAHLTGQDLPCGADGGCDAVDRHYTSNGFGIPFLKTIPTAAFGILLFVALAGLAFARAALAAEAAARTAGNLLWALALAGLLISLYLIYLQAYVIHAWCRWCLASEALVFLIFLLATLERLRPRAPEPRAQGETL